MNDEPRRFCGHMSKHPQNDWGSVRYDPRFDVYWVPAGGAKQQLFFCPWCGNRLPPSQRDRWFDELEAKGIDPNQGIVPVDYQTGAWRGAVETPHQRVHGPVEGRFLDLFDIPNDEIDDA